MDRADLDPAVQRVSPVRRLRPSLARRLLLALSSAARDVALRAGRRRSCLPVASAACSRPGSRSGPLPRARRSAARRRRSTRGCYAQCRASTACGAGALRDDRDVAPRVGRGGGLLVLAAPPARAVAFWSSCSARARGCGCRSDSDERPGGERRVPRAARDRPDRRSAADARHRRAPGRTRCSSSSRSATSRGRSATRICRCSTGGALVNGYSGTFRRAICTLRAALRAARDRAAMRAWPLIRRSGRHAHRRPRRGARDPSGPRACASGSRTSGARLVRADHDDVHLFSAIRHQDSGQGTLSAMRLFPIP